MNESLRVADQLHRSFYKEPWHGPSLKEVLEGISAEGAAARPLPSAHTIWELVNHLHAWLVEAAATVRGKAYESLKGERDWPPVLDTSSEAWERILAALQEAEESLEPAVQALPEEKLGHGDQSLYYLVHGITQHSAYHAGQIAILKKNIPA